MKPLNLWYHLCHPEIAWDKVELFSEWSHMLNTEYTRCEVRTAQYKTADWSNLILYNLFIQWTLIIQTTDHGNNIKWSFSGSALKVDQKHSILQLPWRLRKIPPPSSNWPSDWLWIWSWYIGLVWHASGDTRHWPLPDIRIKSLWPTSGIRHSEDDSEEAGRWTNTRIFRSAGSSSMFKVPPPPSPHLPPSLPLNVTNCMFWNCWSWNEFKCWFSLVSERPYCLFLLLTSNCIVAFKLNCL